MTLSPENYAVFRGCLSNAIVARSEKPRSKRNAKAKRNNRKDVPKVEGTTLIPVADRVDPEELAEFIDFIASETFSSFPEALQTLSYAAIQHDQALAKLYIPEDPDAPFNRALLDPLCSVTPVAVTDSLAVYGLIPDAADFPEFLAPILTEYIASVTSGPPSVVEYTC
ncbi:hypothetical protein N7470_009804 [Penicillium chermesinum]|nr:hypothetical protein N7470_009804 [Penicillium chermesinum]